ncbi:MAG: transcriptional regulator [Pseudomonadota bacterium]
MILHLSEVMNAPLDARNMMMRAVGFAPRYGATPYTDAQMAPIRDAVSWTLERHAPYPGFVIDRVWRIVQLNAPASRLFAPLGLSEGGSMLDLVMHPIMPEVIENWPEVAHHTSIRLRAESAAAGGVAELDAAIEALAAQANASTVPAGPSVSAIYRFGDKRLSFIATIAHFSTVADETLEDLKIELFFPADEASDAILRAMAASD